MNGWLLQTPIPPRPVVRGSYSMAAVADAGERADKLLCALPQFAQAMMRWVVRLASLLSISGGGGTAALRRGSQEVSLTAELSCSVGESLWPATG